FSSDTSLYQSILRGISSANPQNSPQAVLQTPIPPPTSKLTALKCLKYDSREHILVLDSFSSAVVVLIYVVCNRFRVCKFALFGRLSCLFHFFLKCLGFAEAFEEVEEIKAFYMVANAFPVILSRPSLASPSIESPW